MSKVKVELNSSGIKELLKSDAMMQTIKSHAQAVLDRCGEGYEADEYTGTGRVNIGIKAVTDEAKLDNIQNNTLLKALR